MKHRLDPNPCFIIIAVVLAIVTHFPAVWCQEPGPYVVCNQTVQCGDIEFDYPFYGFGRPSYCGHPGFQFTCQSGVPELEYESVYYRVLETPDTSTETITVARNDLWSTLCPQYLHNTTYNQAVLDGDNFGQQNVSMYFGCTTTLPREPLSNTLYQFSCNNINVTQNNGVFIRTDSIEPDMSNTLVRCGNHIIVPVNRSSAERLASGAAQERDLRSALMAGFNLRWTANNNLCDQCIRSDGKCGSNSTSPNLFACYCANGNFSFTCNDTNPPQGEGSSSSNSMRIVLPCGIAGIILLFGIILFLLKKKLCGTRKSADHQIEIFIRNYGSLAPKRYKYSDIKKMTKEFKVKLGQGGYGSVYKGELPDGHLVAVKLLSEATGDGEDFVNEVASIGRTSHVNIVTLIGFCFEGKKRALMYQFMPNGSLDKFLRADGSRLNWNTLFMIAKGIARGLEYLHQGCNTRIVHFDIKPHNILLDEEFVPKISDFGLAKLCKRKESIVSVIGARGTAGYMAPEVFFKNLGGASHKSDVYSYGMMVLEMTGGHKNNNTITTSASEAYFPDWIYKQVETEGSLGDYGVTTEEEEELARKMMIVSLWCIQADPSDRPSISKVVEMLEGTFKSLQVPPRHFWSSPQGTFSLEFQSLTRESLLTVKATGEDFSS